MKKNNWIFPVSVLAFSFLFWKEMPGLNALLFTPLLLLGQIAMNKDVIRNRKWICAAIGAMACSYCVVNYGNALSIFATFFSLLLCAYFAYVRNGSVLIGVLSSIISIGLSIGFMIADGLQRMEKKETSTGNKSGRKILIVCGALCIVLIFFLMYRESSVMFYNLTQKINLDFISFGWIAFTCFGALLLYGFYYLSFSELTEWDSNQALTLSPGKEATWFDKLMSMDSEQFSGIVLFSLLNILLLVVNGLDAAFIFGGSGTLPQGVSCMQYVHQGVGMLITSIVFAMLIILFYFRGRMNFSANGKWLRILALVWIVQNAFMLFSTFWRNDVYILAFGLTYKRIGVFIYLLLTLIGLVVTAWKVYGKKTNAFLIRTNSWIFYFVWVVACFINWDRMVLENNIRVSKSPDLVYLNSLSDNNLAVLYRYTAQHPEVPSAAVVAPGLRERIYVFLESQKYLREEGKWPSFQFGAAMNYKQLLNEPNFGKLDDLTVKNDEVKQIYFFSGFENLRFADFSINDLTDLGEVAKYKNLETLNLNGNYKLVSLAGIEQLGHLKRLCIAGTNVNNFSPLLKLKNLEELLISNDKLTVKLQTELQAINPKLKIEVQY